MEVGELGGGEEGGALRCHEVGSIGCGGKVVYVRVRLVWAGLFRLGLR